MHPALLILFIALSLAAVMTVAWRITLATGNSGWIDSIWSFSVGGFGVIAALMPIDAPAHMPRQLIVAALAGLWSLRLGLHIASRARNSQDDPRYAQLRKEWGKNYRVRLLWFLQIQAAAALVLVVAIMAAARNPVPQLRFADWLGVVILAIAIIGEGVADWQLRQYGKDPANKGEVCDVGLWGLSRHPNYFFEWLGWLAYPAIAISFSGYPWGLVALAGPAFMYWLLVHVSGIPLLEAHMLRSRGDKFRAYQRRINAFWPGMPQERSA